MGLNYLTDNAYREQSRYHNIYGEDMPYTHVVYLPLLVFGFVANILLMIAVVRGTPNTLKIYSILIFYCALNDFIDIIADAAAFERLIVKLPSFTFVSFGACTYIADDLCNYCNSIMTSGLVESIILQSISFWYRNHILSHPSPTARSVHLVVLFATLPNIAHLIAFKHAKVADHALLPAIISVYPDTNWTGATYYGITHLSDPYPLSMFGIFFVIIPILFVYLIVTRTRLLRTLANMSQHGTMSERTVELHRILVKILTIHALLPLSMFFALVGIGLLVLEIYSSELESLAYLSAMIAPIFNPVVTIWYLKPYRTYVLFLLGINSRQSSIVVLPETVSASITKMTDGK